MSTKKKTRQAAPGAASPGLGFERVKHIPGSTYKDASTVVIIPTRSIAAEVEKKRRAKKEGHVFDEKDIEVFGIDQRVISAWRGMLSPMNQQRAELFASGHEVGQAYNDMIAQVLAHPQLKKFKYVLTLEDDNIPPPDAHIRLLEIIEQFKFDAVSGIYFTKGEINMPMAYGDPSRVRAYGSARLQAARHPRCARGWARNAGQRNRDGLRALADGSVPARSRAPGTSR